MHEAPSLLQSPRQHAAVVVVDAAAAAPSFEYHFSAAVAAVVVASPRHILDQHMLPQLERQQLTVRPGFEPQACRVPTQRGIYLFSVTVDIIQGAPLPPPSNRPHRHVSCRGCPCLCCCRLTARPDAHGHGSSHAIGVHVLLRLQLLMVAGTAGAGEKGRFRVRGFGGVVVFAAL